MAPTSVPQRLRKEEHETTSYTDLQEGTVYVRGRTKGPGPGSGLSAWCRKWTFTVETDDNTHYS